MNSPSRRFYHLAGILLSGWMVVAAPPVRADELTRQVQEELRKRNLYFGDVNGLLSPQVAAALRRYQERKGFQPSGAPDDLTLRSLGLEEAGSAASAATPAASGVGGGTTVANAAASLPPTLSVRTPWPDLPVIHSDQARKNPVPPGEADPADVDPTSAPPLKPPPAAVSETGPAVAEVHGFVEDFLRRGESNDPGAQQSFFADRVDYFNEGKVEKSFIVGDTKRYNKRWPVRTFTLVNPLKLSAAPDQSPDQLVVNFRCRFEVKQAARAVKDPKDVKGEVDETYTLTREGAAGLRIIGIKEQRVRGQ